MSTTALAGLMLGATLAAGIVLLTAAISGWTPRSGRSNTTAHPKRPSASQMKRGSAAAAAGLGVALTTRWPVAALAAGALVVLWPRMFGAAATATGQIERIEALATWTESLRDSIAGSIGLEEAIRHSLDAAPEVLIEPLQRLDGRLRIQIPFPQALEAFADEFDDSSSDLVVAALILNSTLRGPGLVATLGALAGASREEIDMRRKIGEGRKTLRRTALIIISVTGIFAAGLVVLSRGYVEPYSSPIGQVFLAMVMAVFAAGLVWIKNAADIRPPPRFLATAPTAMSGVHTAPRNASGSSSTFSTRTRPRRAPSPTSPAPAPAPRDQRS